MRTVIKISKRRWLLGLLMAMVWLHCEKKNPVKPPAEDQPQQQARTDWQAVGNNLSGQTVQVIKADPQHPATIYVGTLEGIFKSTDGGKVWNACNNGLTNKDVTSLVVNPLNGNMLFCGTWGKGVFKSMDGGLTWQSIWGSGLTPLINDVFVKSNTGGVSIWAGTSEGLYRSEDSGTTWSQVQRFGQVLTVNAIENDLQKMLISIRVFGFYRTLDGGLVWAATNNGTTKDTFGQEAAIDYDQHPSLPQVAFALTDRDNLYKTTNGAATWQAIPIAKFKVVERIAFAVEPDQPDNIWLAARTSGVYYSANGGSDWKPFNSGLEKLELKTMAVVRNSKTQIFVGTVNQGLYVYEK